MKLYLAGPMRGIAHFNFPAFHATAARLRAEGHEVFNPAESDNETHGTDISADNPTGSEAQAEQTYGFTLREALLRDTAFICTHAEGIAMLPGWHRSKGAQAERALAIALGLEVIYL